MTRAQVGVSSTMTLAHDRIGGGDPLVLIHGLGSARTVWSLVTPALAEAFDIVAVDLPGHGRTPWVTGTPMDTRSLADSVFKTFDALGMERVHLLGHSLGGWTALEIAAAYPERVASVIALAPGGMRDAPLARIHFAFRLNRYLSVAARPLLPLILPNERLRRIGFARNSPVWQTWPIEICCAVAEAMAMSRGYEPALNATLGRVADCTRRIPSSIPLTIVFGDTDMILPARTSQSRRHVPAHAQWLEWRSCGHAIQLDHPERVVALVQETASVGGRDVTRRERHE